MLKNDGFGKKGWLGAISNDKPMSEGDIIRVKWDNGKSYLHRSNVIQLTDSVCDPNQAFLIRKRKDLRR